MKRKWLKRIVTGVIGVPMVLLASGWVFVNYSPTLGGMHSPMDKLHYASSPNFENGKFKNLELTNMSMSAADMMKTIAGFLAGGEGRAPKEKIHVRHPDPGVIASPNGSTRVVWFGHSAFLLQIDGKNLLIDPMFGSTPAPYPWMGRSRFTDGLPIAVADLPHIDAILLSHDHYDHLDYRSILALKAKTKAFFVPLGVGAHLRAWGVEASRIHELDWWDGADHDSLHFAFTPARHFSGRGLMDRFSTLWGSWVIQGKRDNIFFSADSGYGPHFAEIGTKYGPFDFAMIECGQYNEKWADIHMMPEQSAQAALDVRAKVMMPIHWGSFVLAMHSWTDPVVRVTKKADELHMPIITPQIGDVVALDSLGAFHERWWQEV